MNDELYKLDKWEVAGWLCGVLILGGIGVIYWAVSVLQKGW